MTDADRVLGEGARPLTDDDVCSAALQRLWGYLDKELTADDEDSMPNPMRTQVRFSTGQRRC